MPYPWNSVIRPAHATRFGDWNGDCQWTNVEMARLQQAIAGGPSAYEALLDSNCDGVLTTDGDMARFLLNYANQPAPECSESLLGGGGGMEESAPYSGEDGGTDDGADPPDVPTLAEWLSQEIAPVDLAVFLGQASVTAAEHADDAIGAEMLELLSYLQ